MWEMWDSNTPDGPPGQSPVTATARPRMFCPSLLLAAAVAAVVGGSGFNGLPTIVTMIASLFLDKSYR